MSTASWNLENGAELLANAGDPETAPMLVEAIDGLLNDASPSPNDVPGDVAAEICLYRKRTVNLLRRYGKLYMETSRLPSVLGGMEFRAKISSYPLSTFEDAVIFVFDVERCLGELDPQTYEVIARVVLREETPERAANALRFVRSRIYQLIPEALDQLSEMFLDRGILCRSRISPKSCQEGENGVFSASS